MLNLDMDFLAESIKLHGKNKKEVICCEEMSELTKEICKDIRGEKRRHKIVEEYADILLCLKMLKIIHGINDSELQEWINFKQERQRKRDAEYIKEKEHETAQEI